MVNKKFSNDTLTVIELSKKEALRLQSDKVTPSHLMLGILNLPSTAVVEALEGFEGDINMLHQTLEEDIITTCPDNEEQDREVELDETAQRILRLSVLESIATKCELVEPEHIFLAILHEGESDAAIALAEQEMDYPLMYQAIYFTPDMEKNDPFAVDHHFEEMEGVTPEDAALFAPDSEEEEEKEKARQTPVLEKYGTDLTAAAARDLLDPVVGRQDEIQRMAQILSRRKKNNPILIGEPGVGKSAIVEGLAQQIVRHTVARPLWDKRIVVLDLAAVVAGTKYRGQFEERIRAIVLELEKHPEVVVFIDEIHTLVGAGSAAGTMDAANLLKPALARGEIQCIGATTIDEYRKSIEKDGALERRFQKLIVQPPTAEQTLQILHNLKGRYEEHHNVRYTDQALQACVRLTERYITDRAFPDKAIDALDEAGSRVHIASLPLSPEIEQLQQQILDHETQKRRAEKARDYQQAADLLYQQKTLKAQLALKKKEWEDTLTDETQTVDEEHVAAVISTMTGIPVQRISQEENTRLRNLAATLGAKVIGQDDAIQAVTRAIQRSRIGLKDPAKPIGTFLFVGPTGVGKTYLTKALAEEFFGTEKALIRIDMSEYMEKHTVSRMVGAPPGYVGYEEGGQLTEKVRRNPYAIVLLDEIEKAHPDVFNLLLQVMDEGRLTDGNGTTIDFRNTIIIMTSNSGTRQLKDFGRGVGFSMPATPTQDKSHSRAIIRKSIDKQFAPEFLNRLDNIVYFDQLSETDIARIVDIEVQPLARRISDMGYTLRLADDARALLARKGYDVQYGARPLKRAIQDLLEDPICELLMSDKAPAQGQSTLWARAEGDKIIIETNTNL